jgi:hypothetical protein
MKKLNILYSNKIGLRKIYNNRALYINELQQFNNSNLNNLSLINRNLWSKSRINPSS